MRTPCANDRIAETPRLDTWTVGDMIRPRREQMVVDGEIVGELRVSGPFDACHALPLGLLTFSVTKFSGILPARLSKTRL